MLHSFDFQGDAIACWRRLNMSLCSATCVHVSFIIRLEAKYWIHFTVFLAAFTCLALTPPKLNLFGWYLEHSEYIVGGLALADFWHAPHSSNSWRARRNIVFCHVICEQLTISPICRQPNSTKFEHNTLIGVTMKTFRNWILKNLP